MRMRKYRKEYGRSAYEIIVVFAKKLKTFTYNELAYTIYEYNYNIKLETIKRTIRQLREEGKVKDCGIKGKEKLFCYVG